MSQLTNKYYVEENIESQLTCEGCQKRYNLPKIQPCGCSICVDCETVIFQNNQVNSEIECSICHEKYELPKSFIINKSLNKLLSILPTSIYRGGLHANTMQKLYEGKILDENFSKEINDSRSVILEYCDLQKNAVDIKTECLIKTLNNHRDSLLAQISEFKIKCLEQVQTLNYEKFLEFLNECEKKYKNLNIFLNGSDLNDDDVKEKLDEIMKVRKSFENNRNIFNSLIYKTKKLEFVECNHVLRNYIGEFNYNSLLDHFLMGVNQFQSIKKINYEKENKKVQIPFSLNKTPTVTNSIPAIQNSTNLTFGTAGFSFTFGGNQVPVPATSSLFGSNLAPQFGNLPINNKGEVVAIQTKILEIECDIFCVVTKFKQNEKFHFQIKTFSIDDLLMNEISKELLCGNEYNAFSFQQNILILEKLNNDDFSIKAYDSELKERGSKSLNLFRNLPVVKSYSRQIIQIEYSIIVSKDRFYILKFQDEHTHLSVIDKKLEIEMEDSAPVGVFSLKNTFIESDKIFTFDNNKLNIYRFGNSYVGLNDKYQQLKTVNFSFDCPPECLFHLIDAENFIIINPQTKLFKYLNIETNEIKLEFKIENVNKITSFFITKNNYLAFHDDEEKMIHIFTDGSFKIKNSLIPDEADEHPKEETNQTV